MRITKEQFEILTYVEKYNGSEVSPYKIAKEIHCHETHVFRIIKETDSMGLIQIRDKEALQITRAGVKALEPYRVKRAVIMAAGFGSRMIPLTLNTPKPLIRVNGKMLIETLLDAVIAAEIPEIILVRGYLWEMFDCLLYKYPHIRFVQNPFFDEANNISSVYIVRDILKNAYVCEADLLLNNPKVIRKYEYETNYLGKYTESTDDWCFKVKDGIIQELSVGGRDCYQMYGISYWDEKEGEKIAQEIETVYHMPGGKKRYWDEVSMRIFKDHHKINVRPCYEDDIIEIDTFDELKAVDPAYDV